MPAIFTSAGLMIFFGDQTSAVLASPRTVARGKIFRRFFRSAEIVFATGEKSVKFLVDSSFAEDNL
jgi:hypothetical protein